MKLSPDQKKYIRTNHGRIPPKAMARQLGIEVKYVRRTMRELGLHVEEDRKVEERNQRAARRFLRNEKVAKVLDRIKSPVVAWPLLLLMAFALRLLHLIEIDDSPFFLQLQGEPAFFHHWAERIAQGDWLSRAQPVFRHGPGYAYFLAVIYALAGPSPWAACLVQVIIGALSVGLVYELGRRLFGPATGLMAGLMAACYPMLIFSCARLSSPSLILFLNLLVLLFLAAAMPRPAWWKWLLAGLFSGLSALIEGEILLFIPLAFLAMLAYFGWTHKGRWFGAAFVMALGCLLALSPVSLHNFFIGGELTLPSSRTGLDFYLGNHPDSGGIGGREALARKALKPSQLTGAGIGKTLEGIRENPDTWMAVIGKKLRFIFNSYEVTDSNELASAQAQSLILRLPWPGLGLIMPLGLLGLILLLKRFRKRGLLLMYFSAYLLALSLFIVSANQRLPMVLPLFLGAAVSLRWFWRTARERRWIALSLAGLCLAALTLFVNLTPPMTPGLTDATRSDRSGSDPAAALRSKIPTDA